MQKVLARLRQFFLSSPACRKQHDLQSRGSKYHLDDVSDRSVSNTQQESVHPSPKAKSQHEPFKRDIQKTSPDFIQIEDEFIIRTLWEVKAEKHGLKGLFLNTYQELEKTLPSVDKATPIFIDIQLPNSTKDGFEIARTLFQHGYTDLYLSTGSLASELEEIPCIKEIVGKDFPIHILINSTEPTT
ncbi:hypothetical protein [Zooshikella harenae]|uniref:Response regulator n=1 Tax=Zooshikella harenae TaxID=2827238 RepID=A0ABS5ZDC8_9GAMM|nr:hypothetical protein [Zooshikella harenae]MBU2712072.1 hypothetical protein [Zooshikella harenae]